MLIYLLYFVFQYNLMMDNCSFFWTKKTTPFNLESFIEKSGRSTRHVSAE